MVVPSKWLAETTPDMPIAEVARIALKNRLLTVWHYLPLAATKPEEDVEYIHQLRVSTRRSGAALQIFRSLLPKKSLKWLSRELRRIRKAAGEARDLDVFIERLSRQGQTSHTQALEGVVGDLRIRRQRAQPLVLEVYEDLRLWKLELRIELLVERVRWRERSPEPDFRTAAAEMLRPVIDEFHEARSADFADIEALHQLRICGKALRYAMELLAGAFHKSFRKRVYPTVGEMQDRLGMVNDHAVACERLGSWMREASDPGRIAVLKQLSDRECAALETTAEEFRAWWTPQWAETFEAQLREAMEKQP
jgi:CHAD domain-containing protein